MSVLERNEAFVLDPFTMYEKVRLGVTRTLPLLGSLPGNEQGACFALFLRDPSSASIAPGPGTTATAGPSRPSTLGLVSGNNSPLDGSMDFREKLSFMMFQKSYLVTDKRAQMQGFSSLLSESEKRILYGKFSYHAFWPALGNTLYGLGSWFQGDFLGGALCSGAMIGGLVAMTTGVSTQGQDNTQYNIGLGMMMTGMIFGWIERGSSPRAETSGLGKPSSITDS